MGPPPPYPLLKQPPPPPPPPKKKRKKKEIFQIYFQDLVYVKQRHRPNGSGPLNIGFLVQICRMFHTQTYTVRTGAWDVW